MATNKDKLIAGAQKLVEKGQHEKAIKEYLKVVADDDKDVRIWLKIGDLYAKLGKKPEAAETYAKVAQFYSDQGFYLKAVAVYKQILKIEPRLVDVNHKLAELYKQLGLLSDAMQQYEAVAAFYHREGKTREALAALKQIVELDPETVANRIKLAELYSKEGMVREAIDEFSKAAEQLRQAGRVDDFMKVAERLLFHSPDNRPVTKELAGLYIEKGDPRRALPKLQICFKADPRDTDVLSLLAKAFEALDQRSKSVSVLKELARILGENGDSRGRDATWRKILQLAPGDPDAEAALTNPGRARPPSQPSIDEALASPPPAPRGAVPIARVGKPDNSTGGRPVAMSASGRMRTVDDVDGGRDWEKMSAPKKAMVDPPTRGFAADSDDSTTNSASGGAGAEEEIAKILNETDVYIKYNLHAKAIEHLQRAFERNPKHVGAREKLKALFLILGKKDEAVLELWSLVEHAEPGRKRRYLREILEIDPRNARAAGELGERLAPEPQDATAGIDEFDSMPQAVRDPEGTGSEMLDVEDLEELSDDEFDVAESSIQAANILDDSAIPSTRERRRRVSEIPVPSLEDQDDELIPVVVEQDRRADAAAGEDNGVEDRFGFDDEPAPPVEDRFGGFDEQAEGLAPTDSEAHAVDEGAAVIARESARHPIAPADDDGDVHTRFDDAPLKFDHAALFGGNEEVDEADLPPVGALPGVKGTQTTRAPKPTLDDDDDDIASLSNKPITRTVQTPAALLQDESGPNSAGGSSLEDDLDEADFFTQQSLFEEARAILESLLARHPMHPLVTAKLRDLEAMEQAAVGNDQSLPHVVATPGMTADMSAELPTDLPGDVDAAPSSVTDPAGTFEMTRKGVIEKGVTAEDFETHYDLGIAYKEMGLLDDAINEFRNVMKDPAREVQCHLMIGLCFLEKGMQTDAIGQFKKGLYVEGITEREALSMYFELGQAYERLNDPREALYYYEKVMKRDPHHRDVQKRVDAVRGGGGGNNV
ncbi:MAG: repeat-containing protein, partial [bacterium]|nr:repeat-containing protein [bacterium]